MILDLSRINDYTGILLNTDGANIDTCNSAVVPR